MKANLESIKGEKGRLTRQKKILFELMQQHSSKHLNAYELYQLARKRMKGINLSTVYRNLKSFEAANIIEEQHLDEHHHHYELKAKEEHQHMICSKCGKVIEFQHHSLESLKESLAKKYHFTIEKMKVDLTGLCEGCRVK